MISNAKLRERVARAARMIDRAERWERLAFMEQEEAERLLREHQDDTSSEGYDAGREDDAAGPVGPRNDKNKSRYKLSPGHGQHLSDLLRHTAEARSFNKISKLLNG